MQNPPGDSHAAPSGYAGAERRRHPRVAAPDGVHLSVPIVVNAEVLDISTGGALLSASDALDVGARGHLRMLLDREPFNAWVEVRRVHPGTVVGRDVRHRIGVSFTAVDEASRRTLQRFMRGDGRTP